MTNQGVIWTCAVLAMAVAGCGGGSTFPALPSLPPPKVAVSTPIGQISMKAGETQATVVGPNLKPQCPAGRLLVTNDLNRPPGSGTVVGRDLDDLYGADVATVVDAPPGDPADLGWLTNDHDLSVMANGDVILTFSVHLASDLTPKPAWFDNTWKPTKTGTFGPGVRRGLITWRSTDCGATFQYQSTIDPISLGTDSGNGGECAYPKPVKNATLVDGAYPPPFANGGVDGNLVKVDPLDDSLYLMFQCVGNLPDTTKADFELSTKGVNKTFVLRSTDEGQTWTPLGNLDVARWRPGVAALDGNTLAFGYSGRLLFGSLLAGAYVIDGTAVAPPGVKSGWDSFDDTVSPFSQVGLNIWTATLVFKSPANPSSYLLFPDVITDGEGQKSRGARLYEYDRASQQWAELAPILPTVRNTNNLIVHPTVIETKDGPALLYWYDVDFDAGSATIRGRFVYGGQAVTNDFAIALETPVGGNPPAIHSFAFASATSKYWYGDYHTAGAHAVDAKTWDYYPIWVEPDLTVRFAKVSATTADNPGPGYQPLGAQGIGAVIKAGAPEPLGDPEAPVPESDED